ncbi:MAG: chorismate mutase [Clostridia bacterium]|nr:chorismate mutase [Clostridia bacterium]
MKILAIRGATTVEANTKEEIEAKSVELMCEIVKSNAYDFETVSIIISTTEDITAFYPARAIREAGVLPAPLFSCKEPSIDGALPLCIRVLVTVITNEENAEAKHVYLGKAKNLRKDLAK